MQVFDTPASQLFFVPELSINQTGLAFSWEKPVFPLSDKNRGKLEKPGELNFL